MGEQPFIQSRLNFLIDLFHFCRAYSAIDRLKMLTIKKDWDSESEKQLGKIIKNSVETLTKGDAPLFARFLSRKRKERLQESQTLTS